MGKKGKGGRERGIFGGALGGNTVILGGNVEGRKEEKGGKKEGRKGRSVDLREEEIGKKRKSWKSREMEEREKEVHRREEGRIRRKGERRDGKEGKVGYFGRKLGKREKGWGMDQGKREGEVARGGWRVWKESVEGREWEKRVEGKRQAIGKGGKEEKEIRFNYS